MLETNQRGTLAKSVYAKTKIIHDNIGTVIGQGLIEEYEDDTQFYDCEVVDDENEHH